MLIQNTSNLAVATAPTRPPGNGELVGVTARSNAPVEAMKPAAVQQPSDAQLTQPSDAQLTQEVNKINAALQHANRNLELSFSVDKSTNRQIIKLMDKATGETIVQIPSDAVLAIAQGIDEFQQGLLLKQKA